MKSLERLDITLSNSLVDMYCKCGRMDLAYRVFAKMSQHNVSTWTTMITGVGTHGQERLALDFFERMKKQGVQPNYVTMVGVLNACAHGGLVKEGMVIFDNMKAQYGIEPKAVHYGCIVDMLGRVGRMKEARELAEKMPMGPNAVVWGTLLGASEKHGDIEVGEWAAKNLMKLEPWNEGVYVVLSNIYATAGMWEEVQKLRKVMREHRVAKIPGYSLPNRESKQLL